MNVPIGLNFGDGQVPEPLEFFRLGDNLPDYESRQLFVSCHVFVIEDINENLSSPDRFEFWELIKGISDRIGYQFCKVLTAWTRKSYYEMLFGRTVMNTRTVHELTKINVSDTFVPKNTESSIKGLLQNRQSDEKRLADKYPEYARALLLVKNFWQAVDQSESSDPILKLFVDRLITLQNETSKEDWKSGQRNQYQATTCDFCNSYFRFERKQGVSKAPLHCEKTECVTIYNKKKLQKHREKIVGFS